eukprot:Skav221064  [mRNA]  locus=scaffold3118:207116:209362:- [translate_table: standard]
MDPPQQLEQLLGNLHDWRDVQGVIKTVFQALCDVAHAQSHAVRELERRTGEMQEEIYESLRRKDRSVGENPVPSLCWGKAWYLTRLADVTELRDARLQAEEEVVREGLDASTGLA